MAQGAAKIGNRKSDIENPSVQLLLTCLVDAFYGEVGIATVKVLEHVGCQVTFDERQTCCGQPAFNAGDWKEARKVAEHCIAVFSSRKEAIVCPSASCAAMLRDGYELLFNAQHTTQKTLELAEYLVHQLGFAQWPARKPYVKKIAFHRACHGRALNLKKEAEQLLATIPGIELMNFAQTEQCCGFGGAFSATEPALSAGIGLEKLKNIQASGAAELVSGDMGCLMHLGGLIEKHGIPLKTKHYAQILAETVE